MSDFGRWPPGRGGSWVVQAYDNATRKQTRRSLGTFDNLPAHQRYDAAKKSAEAWFAHVAVGGTTDVVTVRQACEQYVARVRADRGKTADDIEARFVRWVNSDAKLADIPLPKLTRRHIETWRGNLAKAPVVVNPHAAKPRTRPRAPSSVNPDMTALRAALNHAHDDGAVTTDMAWRVALRPIQNADGQRDAYLDRKQRAALIDGAKSDVGMFLRALSLVPLRPGALAALKVAGFDRRLGVLTVGKDKAGRDRKIKLPSDSGSVLRGTYPGQDPGCLIDDAG